MDATQVVGAASLLPVGASLLAMIRMLRSGLHRHFWVLFLYLAFQFLQGLVLFLLPANSPSYYRLFVVSEVIQNIVLIFVVQELAQLAFSKFHGVNDLAHKITFFCVTGSVLFCAILQFYLSPKLAIFRDYVVVWERFLFSALTLFILLMVVVLSRYPVRMTRNFWLYLGVFTVYFLGNFAALSAATIWPDRLLWQNLALSTIAATCFLTWAIAFSRRGSEELTSVRKNLDMTEAARLLRQLDTINEVLARALRPRRLLVGKS